MIKLKVIGGDIRLILGKNTFLRDFLKETRERQLMVLFFEFQIIGIWVLY